jgi:hypothetical protein
MKIQSRALAWVLLLVLFLLFSGCSEDIQQLPSAGKTASGDDLAARIIEAFAEPDRLARIEQLMVALRAVPADQTHAFEEAWLGLEFPNREPARILLVAAWAKHDPIAATKWAKQRERSEIVRSAMYSDSIYLWALEDPQSFIADMDMAVFVASGFEESALRAFVRGWFDSGEPGLDEYIYDMGSQSVDQQRAIDTLARAMVERYGAAATIKWAEGVRGDTRYKTTIYARTAGKIVTVDSKAAVDWCAEVCDSKLGEQMPHMIAAQWARKSGEDAMDFIASRPFTISVQTGSRAAYRQFMIADSDRALAWMESTTEEQRRGRQLEGPVAMYVNKTSALKNPLVAIEWVDYIQDEEVREMSYISVLRRWIRTDETAAEAWMAQSSMSEEAKLKARQS